jgi:MSHA biogenesis protein MshM
MGVDTLHHRLIALGAASKSAVVLIDEAQALPTATLESPCLLTNLGTEQHKLFQVGLCGQPALEATLTRPEFHPLLQRITFAYKLRALDVNDATRYLNERLAVAAGVNRCPLWRRLSWCAAVAVFRGYSISWRTRL